MPWPPGAAYDNDDERPSVCPIKYMYFYQREHYHCLHANASFKTIKNGLRYVKHSNYKYTGHDMCSYDSLQTFLLQILTSLAIVSF